MQSGRCGKEHGACQTNDRHRATVVSCKLRLKVDRSWRDRDVQVASQLNQTCASDTGQLRRCMKAEYRTQWNFRSAGYRTQERGTSGMGEGLSTVGRRLFGKGLMLALALLTIISALIGVGLGLRFKIFIVAPVILLGWILVASGESARYGGAWRIVLAVIVIAAALQLGYIGGLLLRRVHHAAACQISFPKAKL
jgi:hypothetical protein